MKISIPSISRTGKDCWRVVMTVGEKEIESNIIELDRNEIGLFKLENRLVEALLFYCGLDRRFNSDYGKYHDGEAEPFPWDYGDQEDAGIQKALRMAGLDPDLFFAT